MVSIPRGRCQRERAHAGIRSLGGGKQDPDQRTAASTRDELDVAAVFLNDAIDDGCEGLIFPPGDGKALAEKLRRALSNKEAYAHMAAAGLSVTESRREHLNFGHPYKTVDVHLSWLRKKLGESAADSRYLHTVFGVGVKLVDPADA